MKLPKFSLPANDGKTYSAQDWANKNIVLYLYPKDMTSGCTLESNDFQAHLKDFQALGFEVFGLSKDDLKSHDKFCEKEALTFPLLSDTEITLIDDLGAWKEKSMYGKTFLGIERSTFVIQNGEIVQEWRKVKVPGHVKSVLDFIKQV